MTIERVQQPLACRGDAAKGLRRAWQYWSASEPAHCQKRGRACETSIDRL